MIDTCLTAAAPLLAASRDPRLVATIGYPARVTRRWIDRLLSHLAGGDVVSCLQADRKPEGNVRTERLLDIWQRGFARCRSKGWRTCGRHLHEK